MSHVSAIGHHEDSDEDDDLWLYAFSIPYDISYKKKEFKVGDDICLKFPKINKPEHRLFCQITGVQQHEDGTRDFYVMSENSRPHDPPIVIDETTIYDRSIVRSWVFQNQPTTISARLLQSCHDVGVSIQKSKYGYGLFSSKPLSKGDLIPYWGKLSAIQHQVGVYNIQISSSPDVYIIADRSDERGPGAFCNDNTVHIRQDGSVEFTGQQPNARLLCNTPHDSYIDEWIYYKNDGQCVHMFVELLQDIPEQVEICVSYGQHYWKHL